MSPPSWWRTPGGRPDTACPGCPGRPPTAAAAARSLSWIELAVNEPSNFKITEKVPTSRAFSWLEAHLVGAFSVIVKSSRSLVCSSTPQQQLDADKQWRSVWSLAAWTQMVRDPGSWSSSHFNCIVLSFVLLNFWKIYILNFIFWQKWRLNLPLCTLGKEPLSRASSQD